MLPLRFFRDEKGTVGLPIRMVVLTTIGLIGSAVILAGIVNTPAPPRPMYAVSNISNFSIPAGYGDSPPLLITVRNVENVPVGGCNVVIRDPSRTVATAGVTNSDGEIVLSLNNASLPTGRHEGYVSVKAMAEGYRDYSDSYLVKVRAS
ncbi:MAG: hypothetical protein U9N13_09390 [Euryarchaeota archaeon]|nr:hypothetical protein [Euryarchaeota archaeon]